MVKKQNIAIIPARGGSKRIPKKNIIDFFNKPLIAWTIEAAQQANMFDRILVSTDDEEIAEVAKKLGLEVPFFRDKCNDDHSPVSKATIAALNQVELVFGEEYENVIQLMPNCPLRSSDDIRNAYNNFINHKVDFQISCFKFGWMNPWWAVKLDQHLLPTAVFPNSFEIRSQDQPKLYCPTGAIWIAKVSELKKAGTYYGNNHIFYPINWKSAVDIDDYEDLEMAKAIFLMEKSNESNI